MPKKTFLLRLSLVFLLSIALGGQLYCHATGTAHVCLTRNVKPPAVIKWVDFNVPQALLQQAFDYDINSYGTAGHFNWLELLAYTTARNGGNFNARTDCRTMTELTVQLQQGCSLAQLTQKMPYYAYYLEVYTSVLGQMVGEYTIEEAAASGEKQVAVHYGLKGFSPIAAGYSYSHYDDFGRPRSYGYQRNHLGNDLMGAIGTPIIAVEGGVVEALGWNQYGGWRIGIRSFDSKRYYYYAHLRKNHPYVNTLVEGSIVQAGDVIGYLGRSGYSRTENVNNITTPHLHFGLQLIFEESQKDSDNEIWINVYNLVSFLEQNQSPVEKDETTRDYHRRYQFFDF